MCFLILFAHFNRLNLKFSYVISVMYNDQMYKDEANLFCMKEFVKKVETQTLKKNYQKS
jgi:hypothetical protein